MGKELCDYVSSCPFAFVARRFGGMQNILV